MCWSAPATTISVWMYVWITVSSFGQKHLINILNVNIQDHIHQLKSSQHQWNHYYCVLYGEKGSVRLHITNDMVPKYSVEKLGFIHMLNTFDHRYMLQSHNRACLMPTRGSRLQCQKSLKGQKILKRKHLFNESYVHASIQMGILICFCKSMQADMLNLCLQKLDIKRALLFIVSSEF